MRNLFPLLAAFAVPVCLAAEPEWQLLRPTNTGIPGDYTQVVYIDQQQRPWVAAYAPFWEEGGVAWFDGELWHPISSADYPVITSPRFTDIVQDANGMMWIASNDGVLRMDPAIGGDSLVRYDPLNSPLPANNISDLATAPDGTLWIAIHDVVGNDPPGGLIRFDPETNQWTVFTTANGLPWGQEWPDWSSVRHVAVLPDATGYTVWFSSPYFGAATYRDGTFQYFGDGNELPPGAPTTPIKLAGNSPVGPDGELWVWTNQGLARRNPDGTLLIAGSPPDMDTEISVVAALSGGRAAMGTYYSDVFIFTPGSGWQWQGPWANSHTYTLAEAANGDIWVGGIGGAARLTDGAFQRYRLTNTGMMGFWINEIEFAPDGRVFINGNAGTGIGGYNIYDGREWIGVNNANYGIGPPWELPSDNSEGLCYRDNGDLAIAPTGGQGLLKWDGQQYTYLIQQGETITHVEEDTLGRMWAVQEYYLKGLYRFQGNQRVFYSNANSPLPNVAIDKLVVDRVNPGFIWLSVGTAVMHTDGQTWESYPREALGLTQWTSGHFISTFDIADDGTLWIGTGLGVYHFDPKTSQYTRYHIGNTPALPSNEIDHLVITPDGAVWLTTFDSTYPYPGGLSRFDGQQWTTWQQGSSPMPHNQVWVLEQRAIEGGYEVWVGTASEAIAVLTVTTGAGWLTGDMNCDGAVSVADIGGFVLALTNPATYAVQLPQCDMANGDTNGDGSVSVADIGSFVTLLTGP